MDNLEEIINNAKPLGINEKELYCLKGTYIDVSLLVEQILQEIEVNTILKKDYRTLNMLGENSIVELEKALELLRELNK